VTMNLTLRGKSLIGIVVALILIVPTVRVIWIQSIGSNGGRRMSRIKKSCVLDVLERLIMALGVMCLLLSATAFSRDMFLGPLLVVVGWYLILFWVIVPKIRCQGDVDEKECEEE